MWLLTVERCILIVMMMMMMDDDDDDDYDYVVYAFTSDATPDYCGRNHSVKKKHVESQSTAICASTVSC